MTAAHAAPVNTEDSRDRLFAFPERKNNADRADLTGQLDSLLAEKMPAYESFKGYLAHVLRFDPKTMDMERLKEGSKVTAGTVLGRIGKTDELAPHVHFAIRPAGRGAPKIDPKPILDGWKLLEATAIYRAAGKNPFDGSAASASQVLLMSKSQLMRRTLSDPELEIYACGRNDIRTGQIDRRVLAMLEFLTARGYQLTITSLKCGHSILTTSGNVSEHSIGSAVDIAMINGQPVLGNQGPGTLSESLVKDLLTLQGTMKPHQIISLMDYFGADNTFAMADHDDHVHVGYSRAQRQRPRLDLEAVQPDPQARPVGAADPAARRDRQPDRPHQPLRRLPPGRQAQVGAQVGPQARLERPHRRVARDARFPFVQLELAGTVGLDDGRYLGRDPERVLVVERRRRPAPAPPPPRPREAQGRRPRGRRGRRFRAPP